MSDNVRAAALTGQFKGLAAALLGRLQADGGNYSLTVKTVAGSAQISVDASNPAQFGSAQQQSATIANYLSRFDSAQKRGEGDANLMALFKSGFADLHKSYGDWAPQGKTTTRLDLAISQQQQSSLAASYHRALTPGQQLNLTTDPETQNYAFHQIRDNSRSQTDIAYEDGELAKASFTESSTMSTRVSKFIKGKLVDQSSITPTTRVGVTPLRAAEMEFTKA